MSILNSFLLSDLIRIFPFRPPIAFILLSGVNISIFVRSYTDGLTYSHNRVIWLYVLFWVHSLSTQHTFTKLSPWTRHVLKSGPCTITSACVGNQSQLDLNTFFQWQMFVCLFSTQQFIYIYLEPAFYCTEFLWSTFFSFTFHILAQHFRCLYTFPAQPYMIVSSSSHLIFESFSHFAFSLSRFLYCILQLRGIKTRSIGYLK